MKYQNAVYGKIMLCDTEFGHIFSFAKLFIQNYFLKIMQQASDPCQIDGQVLQLSDEYLSKIKAFEKHLQSKELEKNYLTKMTSLAH